MDRRRQSPQPRGAPCGDVSIRTRRTRARSAHQRVRSRDRLVTNGAHLKIMQDGGYQRPELWLSNGWALKTAEAWHAPLYWATPGRRLALLHSSRRMSDRSERAGLPRQLLRSGRFRPLGRMPLTDRARVEVVAQPAPDRRQLPWRADRFIRSRYSNADATQPRATLRRRLGVDPQ